MQQVGPAILATSVELSRPNKAVVLHPSLFSEALAPVFRNSLWLEALFKKIVTFSLPVDLARRSVLQI